MFVSFFYNLKQAGIPVAMCGEMAGDVRLTRLLLGFGLRQFSMHPAYLLAVKQIVLHPSARHHIPAALPPLLGTPYRAADRARGAAGRFHRIL